MPTLNRGSKLTFSKYSFILIFTYSYDSVASNYL